MNFLLPHTTENRLAEMNGFVARTPRVGQPLGYSEFLDLKAYYLFQAPRNGKVTKTPRFYQRNHHEP